MAINNKPKKKSGRPKKEFDLKQIELMGKFRATYKTIADHFGVSERTIERRMTDEEDEFCRHYKKGFAGTKLKLSEAQLKCAIEKLNPSLLIFLGKVYLEQRETTQLDDEGKNGASDYYTRFLEATEKKDAIHATTN